MEPPTPQQVQRARAELLSARETIDASNDVLAAAGLSIETPRRPTSMEINTVALKLPALWPDNPRKWFLYCEGKFRIHKITAQQTMFDHCIHAMTAAQSDVVMDLMERGPSHDCYDDLKRVYIERRTPTTAERMQRLRQLGPLTDQRPSDLLRQMERILGRSIEGDEIGQEEFLRRLPAQTQLIVIMFWTVVCKNSLITDWNTEQIKHCWHRFCLFVVSRFHKAVIRFQANGNES